MFNAPRPAQRYTGSTSNGFGGSFVDENPLSSSVYDDGLDPWSAAPSPSPTPIPQAPSSVFNAVIADATVPSIYHRAYASVDPANTGETSVNALSRVLSTSSLPASTIDRIVNLVSSRPRVSRLEFFVALALVALAQSGKDVSIEQVAALSSQNTLPEPTLDLQALSTITSPASIPRRNTNQTIRATLPAYSSDDPWNSNPRFPANTGNTSFGGAIDGLPTGQPSGLAGTGLPSEWWRKEENIKITILGQQGFILNRYTVYEIQSDRRQTAVARRYSEFTFLWDVLVRRYPFRLFPALPPKRVGADEQFLEQRRRGLTRALNFVVNHPIIKEDGVLAVFLSEPSFETWRKQSAISLEEESASRRVDRIEEMTIPSDLEDKLAVVRGKISPLIEQWQRICILAERIIKRREAAAVRTPALRRAFIRTHLTLPELSPSSTSSSLPPGSPRSMTASLSQSFLGFNTNPNVLSSDNQGDLARLTNTLRVVVEVNETCWRGDDCELSNGVRSGLSQLAAHTQRHSEISELRSRSLQDTTLESLKAQRDLYLATRDLFIRHDRLSLDQVERLKKRIETTSVKLDGIRAAQKENWQEEAEKLTAMIEKDQATIAAQLSRRVFIRACMWHELRVVLHNRENALLTQAVKEFAHEEHEYAENVANNWESLSEAVESMPFE
ncbi:Sorting nexin MVP1 [Psilocybe cubensis]|uniref:Sorting nexin MVP1 n=2 Tax=Psilocybe cubensis TaxID=181762 RepID=A0ACB8GV47_PSICU|nr:Sorting nexin MVP1 [Psilocybe cubensis]KAH9479355.1 Sorting nexin MVP1 [Psilocybe cubensis]